MSSSGKTGLDGQRMGLGLGDPGGSIAELTAMVSKLSDDVNRLSKRLLIVEELNHRGGSPDASRMPSKPNDPYPTIDRRADAVVLPEDAYSTTPSQPQGFARQPSAYAPPNGESSRSLSAAGLVDRYNETVKPNDLAALAEKVRAEYYTNERSGDISSLLRSEIDRFWLVPQSHQSDTAWLIPGFAVRKAWQKFRQFASDHPLAHHFDLQRGDKFVVNRAAVVRKDTNGEWQLVSKGEVSGIL